MHPARSFVVRSLLILLVLLLSSACVTVRPSSSLSKVAEALVDVFARVGAREQTIGIREANRSLPLLFSGSAN